MNANKWNGVVVGGQTVREHHMLLPMFVFKGMNDKIAVMGGQIGFADKVIGHGGRQNGKWGKNILL